MQLIQGRSLALAGRRLAASLRLVAAPTIKVTPGLVALAAGFPVSYSCLHRRLMC
jgi:hypothetical protein